MKKILGLMIIASVIAVASCSGITITTGDDDTVVTNRPSEPGIYVSQATGVDTANGAEWGSPVQSINKGIELAISNSFSYVYVDVSGVFASNAGLAGSGNGVDVTNFNGLTISGGWLRDFVNQTGGFCVVDATGLDSGLNFEGAKDILLYNFAISGGSATVGGGIKMAFCTNVTISNNYVTNNTATSLGAGIGINTGNSNITVINLTIIGNAATSGAANTGGGGMWIGYDVTLSVKNTIISNNTSASEGGAIFANGPDYLTIDNCSLFGTSTVGNTLSFRSTGAPGDIVSLSLINSTIGGATGGAAIKLSGTVTLTGTVISNNIFETTGVTSLMTDGDIIGDTGEWTFTVAQISNLNATNAGNGGNTTNQ